jgi:hypothetical protein
MPLAVIRTDLHPDYCSEFAFAVVTVQLPVMETVIDGTPQACACLQRRRSITSR